MNIFSDIEFVKKWYFLLFLFVPIILYFFNKKQKDGVDFIFLDDIKEIFKSSLYIYYIKIILLFLILINFILIIANPNTTNVSENIKKNGIDIVIALDISWSMEAEDLKPNRIESAKSVINGFIENLKTDRLWLVVFAWRPFTSIPLTFDYNILKETISRLWTENINQQKRWLNWTAIWDAILMWKTLFSKKEEDKEREKVIILLTDWDANSWVDPVLAWLSAKKEWIKIYTIWIWNEKWWLITYNNWPFKQQVKVPPLNDKALKQIAKDTNWEYFRAVDNNAFNEIFNNLQKLEKNDIEVDIKKDYREYYDPFLYILIMLLGLFNFVMFLRPELRKNF